MATTMQNLSIATLMVPILQEKTKVLVKIGKVAPVDWKHCIRTMAQLEHNIIYNL